MSPPTATDANTTWRVRKSLDIFVKLRWVPLSPVSSPIPEIGLCACQGVRFWHYWRLRLSINVLHIHVLCIHIRDFAFAGARFITYGGWWRRELLTITEQRFPLDLLVYLVKLRWRSNRTPGSIHKAPVPARVLSNLAFHVLLHCGVRFGLQLG